MRKFILHWIRKIVSSLFFIGYIPLMPGTVASLVTVGLLWYFRDYTARYFTVQYVVSFWLMFVVFIAVAIFLSNRAKETYGVDDPKQIVIDECAGQIITFFLIPISWRVLILGFLLFRFYDVVKPFPVFKFEEIEDGVGIVMDDVAAGVLANISLFAILWVYHAISSHLV